jgi:hypothetical protein
MRQGGVAAPAVANGYERWSDGSRVLRVVQGGVVTVEREELVVRALLHDPSMFQHDDGVGGTDRRETVSDHEGGAAMERRIER